MSVMDEEYEICPSCGEKKLEYDSESGWDYWYRWYNCLACGESFEYNEVQIEE